MGIRLGAFELHGAFGPTPRARGSFVIPDVAAGEYTILVCNDPCTMSGFGDYVQGCMRVVHTSTEARLLRQADRLDQRLARATRLLRIEHRRVVRITDLLDQEQAANGVLHE